MDQKDFNDYLESKEYVNVLIENMDNIATELVKQNMQNINRIKTDVLKEKADNYNHVYSMYDKPFSLFNLYLDSAYHI